MKKKYIVSLVFGKLIKGVYDENKRIMQEPQVDVKNELYIMSAGSPEEAYDRAKLRGIGKWPEHNLLLKIVVEAHQEDLE